MTFRHFKLFSIRRGHDIGEWSQDAYRNRPARRRAQAFRAIVARQVRKADKRHAAAEIEEQIRD